MIRKCIVANVDANAPVNLPLARKYEISSFPTIKFFPMGDNEPEDYDGPRTEAGIVAYLNEKCGTQRAIGGGLNDEVSSQILVVSKADVKYFVRPDDSLNLICWLTSSLSLPVMPGTQSTRRRLYSLPRQARHRSTIFGSWRKS